MDTQQKITKIRKLAQLGTMPDLVLFNQTEELKAQVDAVKATVDQLPKEIPPFPEQKDVVFPDVQKVEITNFPDTVPVVNVNVPDVIVPEIKAPDITIPNVIVPPVDTTGIEQAIKNIHFPAFPDLPYNGERIAVALSDRQISQLVDGFNKQVKVSVSGGSASGGAKIIEAINNISPPSYDILSASAGGYDYLGKAPPGTDPTAAEWQIARFDENGSKSYADGNTAFDKLWAAKATYTYTN